MYVFARSLPVNLYVSGHLEKEKGRLKSNRLVNYGRSSLCIVRIGLISFSKDDVRFARDLVSERRRQTQSISLIR